MKFIQDDCALESEDKAVGRRGLLGGIATLKGENNLRVTQRR